MKKKMIASIAIVVVGVVSLLFSDYIAKQVAAGKLEIQSGERQLKTADSVFSMSRYTKPVGKSITGSGQKKIDAGNAEIDRYETLSGRLKIGGIILIALGAGLFVFWRRSKD